MLESKEFLVVTDFQYKTKYSWSQLLPKCYFFLFCFFVTNILPNIFLKQQKKENHEDLEMKAE